MESTLRQPRQASMTLQQQIGWVEKKIRKADEVIRKTPVNTPKYHEATHDLTGFKAIQISLTAVRDIEPLKPDFGIKEAS